MNVPADLLEVGRSSEQTYQTVLDFHGWKVAMLRHFNIVDVSNLRRVERHRNTNEVFVLTEGTANLILCTGPSTPEKSYVLSLERNVAYNVPIKTWHHVVMSQDAHIILFERSETGPETTDYATLSPTMLATIRVDLTLKGAL